MEHILIPKCKKEMTKRSFLPSTFRSWNSLNSQCCEVRTKSHFSNLINNIWLNCMVMMVWLWERNILHSVSRSAKIAIAQLRVHFCNLNYDLYIKHYVEAENYECGHTRDDCKHYLFQCSNYTHKITVLLVKTITPKSIKQLYKLSVNENIYIIQAVCEYIINTKRLT